jgi:outer membrane protein assembly factor BamA
LKGAVFLDAGNIWRMRSLFTQQDIDEMYNAGMDPLEVLVLTTWFDTMKFKPSRFLKDIAIGTGIGLRYDLGFLVVRLDWGFAIHAPCMNGINRYFFNVHGFKDLQTLHFAIGYPF